MGHNEYQMPLFFVSCVKDAYGLKILRDISVTYLKILHKPSRAGSTSTRAILSTRSAEIQPYKECTTHV
jgi:hypothetical protein